MFDKLLSDPEALKNIPGLDVNTPEKLKILQELSKNPSALDEKLKALQDLKDGKEIPSHLTDELLRQLGNLSSPSMRLLVTQMVSSVCHRGVPSITVLQHRSIVLCIEPYVCGTQHHFPSYI